MAAVNGAELVRLLKEHGTGDGKLKPARTLLEAANAAGDPIPTAAQVLAALVEAGVGEGTLVKARALAATGVWLGPATATPTTIEDRLSPGGKRERSVTIDMNDGDLQKKFEDFGKGAGQAFAGIEGEFRALRLVIEEQGEEITELKRAVAGLQAAAADGCDREGTDEEGHDADPVKPPLIPAPVPVPPVAPVPPPGGVSGVDRPGVGPVQKGEGDNKPTAGVKAATNPKPK